MMGQYLDIDDVCAQSPLAQKELAELRAKLERAEAELTRLREPVDITQHILRYERLDGDFDELIPAAIGKQMAAQLAEAQRDSGSKQARIDELMFEFCPDEMTKEQLAEWEKHQRVATDAETAAIEAAIKGGKP